jgi:hypothetical protein
MNINKFIGKTTISRVERYEKLKQQCSKEQIRDLEMQLLIPEKLPPHVGSQTTAKTTVDDRTICIVFPNVSSVDLFKKYFKVSTYKGQTVHSINLLIDLLSSIEDGRIIYDAEQREITCT